MLLDMECQCNTPERMSFAGEPLAMCHHTPLQKIAEAQEVLGELLGKFDRNIDPEKLFRMTPEEGVEYYIREIINEDPTLATRFERAVYTTMYVKHYNIVMQLMMLNALSELRKGNFN